MRALTKEEKETYYVRFLLNLGISVALMMIIFEYSAQPAPKSQAVSDGIVYYAIILFQKVVPTITFDTASFIVRKAAHFSEYLLLGFFLCKSVYNLKQLQNPSLIKPAGFLNICTTSWVLTTLYAVSDEIHQSFVPGRSCELRDMCIDACGALIGVLISYAFQHYRALRRK